jgi:sialate O-acetylesterase
LTKKAGHMKVKLFLLLWLVLNVVLDVQCQITLPKLLSDNAVLQRDKQLKIFGWASPGEDITVSFNDDEFATVANPKGEWSITLPPQKAGGPHQFTFKGKNKIDLKNILFGDVWLCSGQSNMEMTMRQVRERYADVIDASANANIRQFEIPDRYNFKEPQPDVSAGKWNESNPQNTPAFSAVGYFFAREIFEKHDVPIGLINAALGGSPAEAWMSEDALSSFPEHHSEMRKFKDDSLIFAIERADKIRIDQWYAELAAKDIGLSSRWKKTDVDDKDWPEMSVPGYWADSPMGEEHGSVWFRRTFTVDKSLAGQRGMLALGRVVDQDSVFVNGTFVGTTGYQYPQRRYVIPEGLLKEGQNSIVVRVINQSGRGGFVADKPYHIKVGESTIDVKGKWKYKLGAAMPSLAGQTFIRWKPGGLYNAMIAPLHGFPITGVIWYQGESNAGRGEEYKKLFPALIRNWRLKWNQDIPFFYVQLANFMEKRDTPTESGWASLRQAQLETLSVPNTGMVVAIDAGEWNDIHPLNKELIAKRLALHARKIVYGEKTLTASGPQPHEWKFTAKEVVIKFKHVAGQLVSKGDSRLNHFAISSDGKNFVWAKARIKKDQVTVWHESITNPVAVRYAWADNPDTANLYNSEGLPATPFELVKQ